MSGSSTGTYTSSLYQKLCQKKRMMCMVHPQVCQHIGGQKVKRYGLRTVKEPILVIGRNKYVNISYSTFHKYMESQKKKRFECLITNQDPGTLSMHVSTFYSSTVTKPPFNTLAMSIFCSQNKCLSDLAMYQH
jgi:hypothetical protein